MPICADWIVALRYYKRATEYIRISGRLCTTWGEQDRPYPVWRSSASDAYQKAAVAVGALLVNAVERGNQSSESRTRDGHAAKMETRMRDEIEEGHKCLMKLADFGGEGGIRMSSRVPVRLL